MRRFPSVRFARRGTSLIEVVLAMGVLAVAFPLVFAAFAKSGESAAAAKAETRCSWIIPACMDEIEAARSGKSSLIPRRQPGVPFPAAGEALVLAFTDDGRPLGRVSAQAYQGGTRTLAGERVRYLVAIRTEAALQATPLPGVPPMLNLQLTLEYPAAAPARKRRSIEFHSRIP